MNLWPRTPAIKERKWQCSQYLDLSMTIVIARSHTRKVTVTQQKPSELRLGQSYGIGILETRSHNKHKPHVKDSLHISMGMLTTGLVRFIHNTAVGVLILLLFI